MRGEATRAVAVIGIEPESYEKIIRLSEKIVAGRLRLGSSETLIGIELARVPGAGIGDKVRLSSASGVVEVLSISGIFDLGSKPANERNVYIALHTTQGLLDLVGGSRPFAPCGKARPGGGYPWLRAIKPPWCLPMNPPAIPIPDHRTRCSH